MRRLLLAFLALTVTGCAGACASAPTLVGMAMPDSPAPDTTGVLRLMGRFASGHACPIAPDKALTAAHVIDLRPFQREIALSPYLWSDGAGHAGVALPVGTFEGSDLAIIKPERGAFAHHYPRAQGVPAPGTRLWLLGYDWRDVNRAFGPRVQSAIVLRVVAGHVILNRGGWPGASGSCWLNAAGEAVAVHTGTAETDNGGRVAVGVGVWR